MIAVIDLGIGNVGSVAHAIRVVGGTVAAGDDPDALERAEGIVLPGVGAFGQGMDALRRKRLIAPLQRLARGGKPVLGICLGMQLLADESEEHGRHAGLGLIPGRVVRLIADEPGCRVPNVGWCDATVVQSSPVTSASLGGRSFYFVHSYQLCCEISADCAMTIEFSGRPVTAAVRRNNIFGVQFHPEKSQDPGLDLMAAFVSYAHARVGDGAVSAG